MHFQSHRKCQWSIGKNAWTHTRHTWQSSSTYNSKSKQVPRRKSIPLKSLLTTQFFLVISSMLHKFLPTINRVRRRKRCSTSSCQADTLSRQLSRDIRLSISWTMLHLEAELRVWTSSVQMTRIWQVSPIDRLKRSLRRENLFYLQPFTWVWMMSSRLYRSFYFLITQNLPSYWQGISIRSHTIMS